MNSTQFKRPELRERLIAVGYDLLSAGVEGQVFGPRRCELLTQARGRVLDVGAGTGANLPHFPWHSGQLAQLALVDPSAGMLERARRKARQLVLTVGTHAQSSGGCALRTNPLTRSCSC